MSESWCVPLIACGQLNSNAKEIFVVGFSSPPIRHITSQSLVVMETA